MTFFSRSVPGLALAGDLLLRPPHAADGVYVLHARDASLPAVPGKEARGRGGAALPAGAGRPVEWECARIESGCDERVSRGCRFKGRGGVACDEAEE